MASQPCKDLAAVAVPSQADGHARSTRDTGYRLIYAAIGFTPIGALALSLVEVVPLHISAPLLLGLAAIAGATIAVVASNFRRPALLGLAAGVVAVTVYDCTRLPFAIWGGWPDFIPSIGAWLVNEPEAPWVIGYLWRYLGNGAGMGLAFVMIAPLVPMLGQRRMGLIYGLLIWSGLLLTVLLSPNGQVKMFRLTPATLALSLLGHLVYGGVLGVIAPRFPRGLLSGSESPGFTNLRLAVDARSGGVTQPEGADPVEFVGPHVRVFETSFADRGNRLSTRWNDVPQKRSQNGSPDQPDQWPNQEWDIIGISCLE